MKKVIGRIYHFIVDFTSEMNRDQVAVFSAQAAFFLLLSLFPFVMTILTFVKYLPITQAQAVSFMNQILPSQIKSNFDFMIAEIFQGKNSIAFTVFSILLTIWSASRGTMAIGRGLTFISGKEDSANYFIRRAIHTIYTFIFCIMLLAVMIIYILGDVIVSKMLVRLDDFDSTNLIDVVTGILSLVKIIFAPTILFGVLLVAYWALPVNKVKIKTAVPGAAFTAVIWMVLSFAVSYYINIIGLNTYMYGSLGSVVILALWMYMCMYVMLIGAEINKLVETIKYEKKNKKQAKSQ